MPAVQFCNLPEETKELIVDVVKKKLQNLGCEFQHRKLRKCDPAFSSMSSVLPNEFEFQASNSSNTLPFWVNTLCEAIETNRETVGMFRINITDSKLQDLKSSLYPNSYTPDISGIEGAALLKNMLRNMNPNLFSTHFTKLLIYIWENFDEKSLLLESLLLLPLPYLLLCKRIFHCFHFIACESNINMMTQHNLATCVSMSLFDLENPQVTTANTLNEIVSFLISVCYQIGTLTEEVYSSAIKAVEQDASRRKWFPVSEKIKMKSSNFKKMSSSASKYETKKSRRSISQTRDVIGRIKSENDSNLSDILSRDMSKKRSRHLFAPEAAKLSPSFTTSDLPELNASGNKNSNTTCEKQSSVERRASFTISGKADFPRSVSSVRKRRLHEDNGSASAFSNVLDESCNVSKLNFVTFDSTPEIGTDTDEDGRVENDRGHGDSNVNTPLLVSAASAARATRLRSETRLKLVNKENNRPAESRIVNSEDQAPNSIAKEKPISVVMARPITTPENRPNERVVSVSSSSSSKKKPAVTPGYGTPFTDRPKPFSRDMVDRLNLSSGKKVSPFGIRASHLTQSSTPKHLAHQQRTPIQRSNLCSITEDKIQRDFEFSPIVDDAVSDVRMTSFARKEDQARMKNDSHNTDNEVFHSANAFDFDDVSSLPLNEDDRRISFCLQTDSHKSNFQSLKQLWESPNSALDD